MPIIEGSSHLVRNTSTFQWKIENFCVHDLVEGGNCIIKSPSFKCGNEDFHLEMSRVPEQILLYVVRSGYRDSSWCTSFTFQFFPYRNYSGKALHSCTATKISDIGCAIPSEQFRTDGRRLTVRFDFTTASLEHDTNTPLDTVNEKDTVLKQGINNLSSNMKNMLENSLFSDVSLKVGEETFKAHKAVLATRSKVFEAMFESGMKEGLENEVNMVEMKSETLKEMLQYIYTGKIQELSMDRAVDLYVAADRYDLQELRDGCKDFICKHISAGDVCKVASLAHLHSDENLAEAAKHIYLAESEAIEATEEWTDFMKKNLTVYLILIFSKISTSLETLQKSFKSMKF